MSIFQKATNTQAFAKVGLLGFAGTGKTFTGTQIAIGLVEHLRKKGIESGAKPAMFLDTETGSDWVKPQFDDAGIDLFTAKTRAFRDLIAAVDEAEASGSVLMIDSISHFWRELMDSYMKKKRRTSLQFQDWSVLKGEWGRFTDRFVNSNVHIVMCGRAGYEYDYFERDDGKKELEKTGIKMKAETETGYEPSLLILMERHHDLEKNKVWRTASVLKDRATRLDGKEFRNPKFKDFLPHIEFLNLGGEQLGVDTSRTSETLFDGQGDTQWRRDKQEKEIALEEIGEVVRKHHGGASADAKEARLSLMEKHFGTRAWKRIEALPLDELKTARNALWLELEGIEYSFAGPPKDDVDEDIPRSVEGDIDSAVTPAGGEAIPA